MPLNKVILEGRIPFDINHFEGTDGKKSMSIFKISVQRSYKKPGEQYYPEDLITCKAWGPTADFVNQYFEQGKGIIVVGELAEGGTYQKDGEDVKEEMFVRVSDVSFQSRSNNSASTGSNNTPKKLEKKTTSAPKKTLGSKKKGTNPLIAKKSVLS